MSAHIPIDRLKAVPHPQAAECELVRLLGMDDEDRGLHVSEAIGLHRFTDLREKLQKGSLTSREIETIAKSVTEPTAQSFEKQSKEIK